MLKERKYNFENQNECESWRQQWRYPHRLLAINFNSSMNGTTTMKIKTNVKAGDMPPNHNQTVAHGLKVKTNVKAGLAGDPQGQHNQTVARGLKVKTNVKAGEGQLQHNQTVAKGLKVKTGIKAGQSDTPIIRD